MICIQEQDLFQTLTFEITNDYYKQNINLNNNMDTNCITILSFCSGDADHEQKLVSMINQEIQNNKPHIDIILYDVYYNEFFYKRHEDQKITNKFREITNNVSIIFCDKVVDIIPYIANKHINCVIGFNTQECYMIPEEHLVSMKAYEFFITETRKQKSLKSFSNMLMQVVPDIKTTLFYTLRYYNKNEFKIECNNFIDFYLDHEYQKPYYSKKSNKN